MRKISKSMKIVFTEDHSGPSDSVRKAYKELRKLNGAVPRRLVDNDSCALTGKEAGKVQFAHMGSRLAGIYRWSNGQDRYD